jgi:predicted metal-dependent hydrolase
MSPNLRVGPDTFYHLEFRKVKNPSVEFEPGRMTIILPEGDNPQEVVRAHSEWIGRMHASVQSVLRVAKTRKLKERTQAEFRTLVWKLAEEYAKELGVEFYKIRFKKATEKWACCGTDGNLTFNTLMRNLPENLIEYVVFHEIAHRRQMDHGKAFQRIMKDRFPNKTKLDVELYVYWLTVNRVNGRAPSA